MCAVSYTHLDVYKRQGLVCMRVHRGQKFSTFPIERCLESVSYTHLDVYKRQIVDCVTS